MGEVFDRHTDTAGNEHWCDTETGKHKIPASEHSTWGKFMREPTEEEQKGIDEYIQKIQTSNSLKGWICPVCGRGLSPFTSVCPCKGYNMSWRV